MTEKKITKNFRHCLSKVNKAVKDFSMFHREERLLLALSGGKDSVALLFFLKKLNFKVEALHIDLGIENFSKESWAVCRQVCDHLDVPLHYVSSAQEKSLAVDNIPVMYQGNECAICGSLKRQLFNAFALENHFDVLLVAHNMDDEAVMLFANNKNWDFSYLKKSYPLVAAQKGFVRRAKPLVYCREKELQIVGEEIFSAHNFKKITSSCTYAKAGSRLRYTKIFDSIAKEYPNFLTEYYKNFLKNYSVIENIVQDNIVLQPCEQCGELTVASLCRICAVKQKKWRV